MAGAIGQQGKTRLAKALGRPTRRRRSRTYQPMGYIGLPVLKTAQQWLNQAADAS
jgi:hypothetical protein